VTEQLDLFDYVEPAPSKVIAGSRDRFLDKWRIRFVYESGEIDRTRSGDILTFQPKRTDSDPVHQKRDIA